MKNKFKKSKIIVPALALITATTVASVTGTVAWFTANQAVTFTGSKFKVANLEGSLEVVATGDSEKGTSADTGDNKGVISVIATGMADASYDGSKIYTDVDNTNGAATGFKEVNYKHEATGYYYAVEWTETFKLKITEGQTNTYNIFFDPSTSKAEGTGTANQALRISMKATGNSTPRVVYAPNVTASAAATTGYVNGTASNATSTYTAVSGTTYTSTSTTNVFGNDNGSTWTTDNHAAASTVENANKRTDYLGTTSVDQTVSSLDVTFTAWFEGLDSSTNVSNITELADLSVTLGFYARVVTTA